MTDNNDTADEHSAGSKIKKDFASDGAQGTLNALFTADELDIYVNKVTLEAYIFHGKDVNYKNLDHLEYNHFDYSVTIIHKDGTKSDLGVKIQWLVRPYFTKAEEVKIVQTKDGDAIDGITVPLIHNDSFN